MSGQSDIRWLAARLHQQGRIIEALVRDVSDEQARWKPSPDQWSMLEVVCHLSDEEVFDFRARLDLLLHQPAAPWPSIDPPRWVVERQYNERDLDESIARFIEERALSVGWVRELVTPNWAATHQHPDLGALSARDIATSWAAHDLLHTRQLARLRYEHLPLEFPGGNPQYAGGW